MVGWQTFTRKNLTLLLQQGEQPVAADGESGLPLCVMECNLSRCFLTNTGVVMCLLLAVWDEFSIECKAQARHALPTIMPNTLCQIAGGMA